jgi:sugar phosphate isomerase/epimerase
MPMADIRGNVQVNIPFSMLREGHIEVFVDRGLNPEIGIGADALDRFAPSQFERIASRLKDRGLSVTLHGPFMDLAPGSTDPQILRASHRRLDQFLALVPLFAPKTVVCHAGYDRTRDGYRSGDWLDTAAATWHRLGRRIRAAGSRLMLENVYEHNPEVLRHLFARLQDIPVGFCLDTGHQAAFSRTSLDGWLTALGGFLRQVHLHDNHGDQDAHLALGQGGIDFVALMNRLERLHPVPPVITLEPHREEDLAPSLAYLQAIWPWPG